MVFQAGDDGRGYRNMCRMEYPSARLELTPLVSDIIMQCLYSTRTQVSISINTGIYTTLYYTCAGTGQ